MHQKKNFTLFICKKLGEAFFLREIVSNTFIVSTVYLLKRKVMSSYSDSVSLSISGSGSERSGVDGSSQSTSSDREQLGRSAKRVGGKQDVDGLQKMCELNTLYSGGRSC